MERKTSSFEDHLKMVEAGHDKTASNKNVGRTDASLLQKLAEELGEGAAPTAEGEKELPGKNPSTTSPEVSAATDGVINAQMVAAGGDPARQAAGMMPHVVAPVGAAVPIATGENTVTIAENLNRTPEAVAAAGRGAGGEQGGKLESAAEAEKIGQLIAQSFQATLEKSAEAQQYAEALEILKSAELLDGYEIKDSGISKTASVISGGLEKIANNQPLSREDIISAAAEYLDLEKQASAADAAGREDAHNFVDFVNSIQQNSAEEGKESEKIAGLMQDQEVVNAVNILKSKGLL
jgi:hypothetical protein